MSVLSSSTSASASAVKAAFMEAVTKMFPTSTTQALIEQVTQFEIALTECLDIHYDILEASSIAFQKEIEKREGEQLARLKRHGFKSYADFMNSGK